MSRLETRLAERGGVVELLRVPALLWSAVSGSRRALYDRGLLPSFRLEAPVVCVGNLSVGGTGKTPMVVLVARKLARLGRRPGILSRGYRAREEGEGDEARLLREALPDVPHVARPDRVRGGEELLALGADVVILDDGFQHRRLRRDLDLVLLDATRPFGLPAPRGGGRAVCSVLPRGLLREGPAGLARAHAVVLTRAGQADPAELERLRQLVAAHAPGTPVLVADHRPSSCESPDGEALPAAWLADRAVSLVSGIGNPEAFERTVVGLGARVAEHRVFPDHHEFRPADLSGLAEPVVTTSKDAVKIRAFGGRAHVLRVELEIVRGEEVLDELLAGLPLSRAERERAAIHEGLHG